MSREFGPESKNPRMRRAFAHAMVEKLRKGEVDAETAEYAAYMASHTRKGRDSGFGNAIINALVRKEQPISIIYGLHGGRPFLIGGGSRDDLDRALAEAEVAEAGAEPDQALKAGSRRFLEVLGDTGGVRPFTEAAFEHMDALGEEAAQAMREVFGASEEPV